MKFPSVRDLLFLFLFSVVMVWAACTGVSGYLQTPVDKGDVVVYGSKTCPWCVKQESYLKYQGIPYNFVDCRETQCPDFVDGFPTLVVNGQVMSGYTELGPGLTKPAEY